MPSTCDRLTQERADRCECLQIGKDPFVAAPPIFRASVIFAPEFAYVLESSEDFS